LELAKKHAEKIKYIIVGLANTAIDFGILFLLVHFGVDKIIANYISTSIALIFSFFVNRSFTFKSTSDNKKKQFLLFIVVTLFGLWVLQPIVITLVSHIISSLFSSALVLFIAKVIATGVSLVWNYIFYSRIVFKKAEEK
jgi:putative flippase GtrA